MNISVIITAIGGKHIVSCIQSVLEQNVRIDEMVVLMYQCPDRRIGEAQDIRDSRIKIVPLTGAMMGLGEDRIKYIQEAAGPLVLCIDGNSVAWHNWAKEMKKSLLDEHILVGSPVHCIGSIGIRLRNGIARLRTLFRKPPELTQKTIEGLIRKQSFGLLLDNRDSRRFACCSLEESIQTKEKDPVMDFDVRLFVQRMAREGLLGYVTNTQVTSRIC